MQTRAETLQQIASMQMHLCGDKESRYVNCEDA